MKNSAPAAQGGQRLNLDRQKSQFSKDYPKLPIGKNREQVLEELAHKWHPMGLYKSPTRAMIAVLGDVYGH
jgi:hypothetical protein